MQSGGDRIRWSLQLPTGTEEKTMICGTRSRLFLALSLLILPVAVRGGAGDAPSTEEQMEALVATCDASADARAARQAERSLYERLGGYERILELTTEIVRLHKQNAAIKQMFEHVDSGRLARQVADFMSAGTGGTAEYTGRTMPAAHANLKLTDADFLSAGGDIVTAMKNKGHGQQEIDDVVCILVSLKDQVVLQ